MTYTTLFFIIVAFIVVETAWEKYLDHRNRIASTQPLPKEVEGLYSEEAYRKQQEYFAANNKFGNFTDVVSLAVTLILLFTFAFKYIDDFARSFGLSEPWTAAIFVVLTNLISDVISIPMSAYKNFVIEEKFGFNKMTVGTFIGDIIKNMLISIVLMTVVVAALAYVYQWLGVNYWIIGSAILAGIMIFFMMFYTSIIVPLFNKMTPLEDGSLRTAIEEFSKKTGFEISDIYIIDGSKRSSKANAFFSGLGSRKRICLYDTLKDKMTDDEIVAVLAHEIGHQKCKHTTKQLILGILNMVFILFLSSLFLGDPETGNADLAAVFGSETPSFHLSLYAFMLLMSPISTLVGWLVNNLTRKYEYEADAFAKKHGKGEELVTALKKLSADSLSNLTPDSLFVSYHYSHPTLVQRIKAIFKAERLELRD